MSEIRFSGSLEDEVNSQVSRGGEIAQPIEETLIEPDVHSHSALRADVLPRTAPMSNNCACRRPARAEGAGAV
jgi:hypothetical protein